MKNNLFIGFLIGLVFPAISWISFNVIWPNLVLLNKPAIPYLVAIGLNLFIIRYCYKKDADQAGRGVMMSTFLFMLLIFIFKTRL